MKGVGGGRIVLSREVGRRLLMGLSMSLERGEVRTTSRRP